MNGQIHVNRSIAGPGIVLIEIDNPPSNALGHSLRLVLEAELDAIEKDHDVRVVILTGRGKGFCAGDDLREKAAQAIADSAELRPFSHLLLKVERLRVPVIGAINGHAVGGGLELALCCDIRLAAANAKFVAAGVNVGLMASVHRLPRLVGSAAAAAIILSGQPVDAAHAHRIGMVSEVYAPEALMDAAIALATRIATRAPLSVEASKRMIRQAFDLTPEAARAEAAREVADLSRSHDHREAVKAFAEKRDPVFTRS